MILPKALNPNGYALSVGASANLADLAAKMSLVEQAYMADGGRAFTVTSGVRTWAHHARIYADINAKRAEVNLPPVAVPKRSHHLCEDENDQPVDGANAVDIADPNKQLWNWLLANLPLLEKLGLYLEMRMGGWVHFQRVPPKSGKRIFTP